MRSRSPDERAARNPGRALPHGRIAPGFASLTRATRHVKNDIYAEQDIYEISSPG
jgi:hypothetical protein